MFGYSESHYEEDMPLDLDKMAGHSSYSNHHSCFLPSVNECIAVLENNITQSITQSDCIWENVQLRCDAISSDTPSSITTRHRVSNAEMF